MTTMLATMADALIDFILSLLRDPAAQEEFDADPQGTLSARGMQNVSHADLCSVLPIVYDHPQVVQRPVPPPSNDTNDVVREIKNVVSTNSYITNNSTLVDQSVNQNIWAHGDVMQVFDNEAVLATGENSNAAGEDIVNDSSHDASTTIIAGDDANVGNQTDVSIVEDSYNSTSDASTTDNSVDVELTDVDLVVADEAPAADAPADDGMLIAPDGLEEAYEDDGY